ncbi:ShET2/EspL2 family type III secretion system effector toxin [Escherichia coli]|nr:ShET2/EspL2 family type III secretion system effector toxin [Escherichia coli]
MHFTGKPKSLIECRHFALQYCIDSMNEHTGKVPLKAYYSSPEDIQKHIPFELEQQFNNLQKNPPPGTCVVASDKFGEALSVFFSQNGKREVNAYDGNRSISNTRYGRPLEDQKNACW